ncbi:hypothetical protein MEP402_gp41 [Methylophilales phage MEP402]|nr:hypothetical protein MEP402_gp41 [Methylophilales phage MEP402]
MTIQHKLITGADLHEPKGVASASNKTVYVANGSGSGAWSTVATDSLALPKGKVYFYNTGSPYTLAHSGSTAKVAPTTVASGLGSLVTEATSARLTYTGTPTTVVKLDYDVSLSQASGADRDIMVSVHRNGSVIAGSQTVVTSVTGDLVQMAGSCFYNAATNDYFEIYAQNTGASGDMVFQKVALTLTAT